MRQQQQNWRMPAVLVGTLILSGVLGDNKKTSLKDEMEKLKVVPDVLPIAPRANVEVWPYLLLCTVIQEPFQMFLDYPCSFCTPTTFYEKFI